MSGLIAVLSKKDVDVAGRAIVMLKMLRHANPKTFAIAASNTIAIEEHWEALYNRDIASPVVIGSAASNTLKRSNSRPLGIENAVLVFDGRINAETDAPIELESIHKKLKQQGEKTEDFALRFLREVDGDYAFVIAETGTLVAGRDIMGARPLYYGENVDSVALASERKALWRINIEITHSFPPGHVAIADKHGFKFVSAERLERVPMHHMTMQVASNRLEALLRRSIGLLVSDLKKVAVAFSGGLDSSIVAFLAKDSCADVHLIHVSLKNQTESNHAKRAAEDLKLPIHSSRYTEGDVEAVLPEVLWLIEDFNPMKTAVGIPFYWVAEKAADMNLGVVLSGQGADELFGGYKKYVDCYLQHGSKIVEEMLLEDTLKAHLRNFERDYKICNHHGVESRLPFASHPIAKFAMSVPLDLKIAYPNTSLRKLVLRQLAKNIGLPKSIVSRPKKAIQYTTGVAKTLQKLAGQRGLSLTKYLQKTFNVTRRRMIERE